MERWERINTAAPEAAREQLRICCGASRWIDRMMDRRPFVSREDACSAAREAWFALTPDDWLEAFAHHPRIGESPSGAGSASPSAREQAGVSSAPTEVKQALAQGNREYEARFGHIYLVCATGKSADAMLSILRARLNNDPNTELNVAAEEHAKICELRLISQV